MDQQQHEMVLEKTYPSGADEWYCPACGRRLLLDYGPKLKKTVLEAGDEYAVHSGGKGGLQMGAVRAEQGPDSAPEDEPVIPIDDPRLAPWNAWLDEAGFDDLWPDDSQ